MENSDGEHKPTESTYEDKIGILEDSHSYQVRLITHMGCFVLYFKCYLENFENIYVDCRYLTLKVYILPSATLKMSFC